MNNLKSGIATLCQVESKIQANQKIFLWQKPESSKVFFSDDWTMYPNQQMDEDNTTKWIVYRGSDGYYRLINNNTGAFLTRFVTQVRAKSSSNWFNDWDDIYNKWQFEILDYSQDWLDCYIKAPETIGLNTSAYIQDGMTKEKPGEYRKGRLNSDPILLRINILGEI